MTKKIDINSEDIIGEATLNKIANADKLNNWMFATIKPFCKGKVLEIGSGIGNISNYFIKNDYSIMLTDINDGYCSKLLAKYSKYPNFLGVEKMDISDQNFETLFFHHLGQYDTVFALNVVEHINDDVFALQNCYKLLADGGQIVILVPAYQNLFNGFDKELGHYRRYTKSSLIEVFSKTKFKIIKKQYFNFSGILGWYFSGTLLKKKEIPSEQMRLYNFLVPMFKVIDNLLFNQVGLSVIIVGKKHYKED